MWGNIEMRHAPLETITRTSEENNDHRGQNNVAHGSNEN
jgi:hypothetical protein